MFLMNKSTAPAWSLSPRHPARRREEKPGPGAYDPAASPGSKTGGKLGKEARDQLRNKESVPGPGTYDPALRKSGSAPGFGSGIRTALSPRSEAPGPGAYDVTGDPAGPKYGMKGRHPPNVDSEVPGPGQYTQDLNPYVVEMTPLWSFGRETRGGKKPMKGVPGPGNYDPKLMGKTPNGRFGSEQRTKSSRGDVPGPGTYESPNTIDKIAFSLTSRHYIPDKEEKPGPGAYDPDAVPGNSGFRLGTAARVTDKTTDIPGPGTYDPRLVKSPSGNTFGQGTRPPLTRISSVPGPGTYQPDDGPHGPQFGMKGRHPAVVESDMPGPGHYNHDLLPENSPYWSFAKDKKGLRLGRKNVPGPGNYDPKLLGRTPNGRFGSEQRTKSARAEVPGPGTYESPNTIDKIAFSLTSRHFIPDKEEKPGPGAYDPDAVAGNSGFRLGTAARTSSKKVDIPGPGAYDPRLVKTSSSNRFGKGNRPPLTHINPVPGPGAYDPSTGRPSGPEFAMKGRHPAVADSDMPGPGHYNQELPVVGAANWTFARDSKGLKLGKRDVPGPGNYDPRLGPGSPGWRFGSGTREKRGRSDEPGPGAYDLPDTIDKVAFSLTSRHAKVDKEERPGPGAYDPQMAQTAPHFSVGLATRGKPIKKSLDPGPGQYENPPKSAPSSKFGTGRRTHLGPKVETPGPGTYDNLPGKGGPRFTFKGRYYSAIDSDVPGPGQYNQELPRQVSEPNLAFNFGSESREKALFNPKKLAEGVGPGMYHKELSPGAPHWSFGTQKRGHGLKTGPPGPGQYDIPSTIGVAAPYAIPH